MLKDVHFLTAHSDKATRTLNALNSEEIELDLVEAK